MFHSSWVHRRCAFSCPLLMRRLIRRLASLPGTILGLAASMVFASRQVWGQAAPISPSAKAAAPAGRFFTPITPAIEGKLTNMAIVGAKGDTIELTYQNTGTVPMPIAGEVQVHAGADDTVASVPFVDGLMVRAGATQRFRVPMPKLTKGRYTLIAIVDYGGETMTAAQAKLDIR